jgi:hypothetical protein
VQEANVPTVAEHLIALTQGYFARADVMERMKPLEAAWAKIFSGFFEKADAALQRVADSPPSPGYEPWLIEHGYNPILARMMAALVVRRGNRIAKENVKLPATVKAIRFLAKPGRTRRAISRKVNLLLAVWEETSVMDTILNDTGLDVFEFVRVLKLVASGEEVAYPRLTEIAALLTPRMSIPRGIKVSAASAAHEFFLEEGVSRIEQRAFTYNEPEGKCTDPVTEATRREFGRRHFDPRPAYRRLTARHKRDALIAGRNA